MKERIYAGLAASLAALLLPVALMGHREAQIAAEPALTSAERTVSAIVVHEAAEAGYDQSVTVEVTVDGAAVSMTLEDYLCGVLMGEMPAEFPMEALKAQAVAARTYTLRQIENGGTLSDDPAVCQAYCDMATAQEKYGENWEETVDTLREAVSATDGQVMTYDGALIVATYFSCSGGKTESAVAVWGGDVPYLVSVDSPGEESAGCYESTVTVDMATFLETLEITEATVGDVTYTEGGGVDTVELGGRTFTGLELRSLFGLRSTNFTLELTADAVTFRVLGYGHRVGLSQYGAKAMDENGYDYEEILTWYYTGAVLTTRTA